MTKKAAKDDREAAVSGRSGQPQAGPRDETGAAADGAQPAIESEPQRRARPKKPRESLHAWIVHFDAERSSGPPGPNDEA
ncbi:hypothetical protein LJ655_12100 [Paraburkholderia sp. MMS20-SJTN17]|uniref:Uncharacterized protein n=1 Tax=Paraburkholderia translucens TaxID=2886945 RepID=A0ABS8KCZ3_9BURK|nr:hypothetical protein [Paraburkholderia sp. MMS20-SJTN17]MCC8402624.1 hypothetical protein [Paraburkholderia sp. MMS20-SJTN17]